MKIPCIEISKEDWKYMKPILERFGYKTGRIGEVSRRPILVLNVDGNFGDCEVLFSSVYTITLNKYNRYLVNDKKVFLEKAKELMGKFCERKEFTLKDIKPGMVVEYKNGSRALALESNNELYFTSNDGWMKRSSYDEQTLSLKEKTAITYDDFDIVAVYKPKTFNTIKVIFNDDNLIVIWKKPKTIRQISKKAIEKAFNIKPDEELVIVE